MRSRIAQIFRYVYLAASWAFLAGLVYQVYTAGQAAVSHTAGWGDHAGFGFLILIASLLQLLVILPARLPRPAGWVSLGLFAAVLVQVVLAANRPSPISALHPVLALFAFSLSLWLALASLRAVRRAPADG